MGVGGLNLTELLGSPEPGTNNISLCRVVGTIAYGESRNDTLTFELWLPDNTNYNGRYLSVGMRTAQKQRIILHNSYSLFAGNGGFAGNIDYATMLINLNDGFAVGGFAFQKLFF